MTTRSAHSIANAPFKAAPLAAAIAALTLSLPAPALADIPEPRCEQLVCTVPVTDELSFEVSADSFVHYGNRLEISGQVVLHTPVQRLTLNEADLVLEERPGAALLPFRLYGTARPQMNELPIFGDESVVNHTPVAVVGLVDRATLKGLLEDEDTKLPLSEIPKDPYGDPAVLTDPAYLFLHFQTGLSADVSLVDALGLDAFGVDPNTLKFKVPMEKSLTVVVDPAEPYFLLAQDDDIQLVDRLSPDHQAAAARAQVAESRAASSTGGVQDDPETPMPELGQLAFSAQGGIPFEPQNTWGLPEEVGSFKGQLLVDAEIPLFDILEINGTLLNRIGEQDGLIGAQFGANGDFGIDFELIPGLDFEFPVLDGTLGMFVDQDNVEIYFSGRQARDYSFLPDFVPLKPSEDTRVAGYISRYKLDESRLIADGRYTLSMASFGQMIGVPLQDLEILHAQLTLDKRGVLVKGKTGGSIHPDVDLKTEANLSVWISFSDPRASQLVMSGEMNVLGAGFKPVTLIVDRSGLTATGVFSTPISSVSMYGRIDANGPHLSGQTTVRFSYNEVMAALAPLDAALRAAQAVHSKALEALEKARQTVKQERARLVQALRDAEQELQSARDDYIWARDRLQAHYNNIRYWRTEITNKRNWYNGLSEWEKVWHSVSTGTYIAERLAWITAEFAKITLVSAKKTAAETAVAVAEAAVKLARESLPSIPVDADPRVIPLLGPERVAALAESVARANRNAAYAALPAWAKSAGGLSGTMQLQLNRSGMSGSIRTVNNVQVSADIALGASPKICLDFPGVGRSCKAL